MSAPTATAPVVPDDAISVQHDPVAPTAVTSTSPVDAGDPSILGLPIFAAASIALGLTLVGLVSDAAAGTPIAIIFAATGIGLLISTVWAIRVGQTMVASVFGLFAGFWLSYAALVLGLTHNWYLVPPADIADTQLVFQITWAVVFAALTFASVRLPSGFTLVFGLVVLSLVLLIIGNLTTSTFPVRLAGITALAFAGVGVYLFLAAASAATGGRPYSIGRPLAR
jgi:succinate-acetate transporter protein